MEPLKNYQPNISMDDSADDAFFNDVAAEQPVVCPQAAPAGPPQASAANLLKGNMTEASNKSRLR